MKLLLRVVCLGAILASVCITCLVDAAPTVAVGDVVSFYPDSASVPVPLLVTGVSSTSVYGCAMGPFKQRGATVAQNTLRCLPNLIPWASGATVGSWTAVLTARATTSAQQTGTGASQNVAHALGVIPTVCAAIPEATADGGGIGRGTAALAFVVTQGTHTTTNCVYTVSAGAVFRSVAIR